jgi:hypothetical protein
MDVKEGVMALLKVPFLHELAVSRHFSGTGQECCRSSQPVWCEVSNMRTTISDKRGTKMYATIQIHFPEKVKGLYYGGNAGEF